MRESASFEVGSRLFQNHSFIMAQRQITIATVTIHDPKNEGGTLNINARDFIEGVHVLATERRPKNLSPINATLEDARKATSRKEAPEVVAQKAIKARRGTRNAADDDSGHRGIE